LPIDVLWVVQASGRRPGEAQYMGGTIPHCPPLSSFLARCNPVAQSHVHPCTHSPRHTPSHPRDHTPTEPHVRTATPPHCHPSTQPFRYLPLAHPATLSHGPTSSSSQPASPPSSPLHLTSLHRSPAQPIPVHPSPIQTGRLCVDNQPVQKLDQYWTGIGPVFGPHIGIGPCLVSLPLCMCNVWPATQPPIRSAI
jgi:hypothetical protein